MLLPAQSTPEGPPDPPHCRSRGTTSGWAKGRDSSRQKKYTREVWLGRGYFRCRLLGAQAFTCRLGFPARTKSDGRRHSDKTLAPRHTPHTTPDTKSVLGEHLVDLHDPVVYPLQRYLRPREAPELDEVARLDRHGHGLAVRGASAGSRGHHLRESNTSGTYPTTYVRRRGCGVREAGVNILYEVQLK